MQEIQRYASSTVCKMLVGNKYDLDDRRVIGTSTAREYADGLSIPFIETSAKTGHEIENAFQKLTDEVMRQHAGNWGGDQKVILPPRIKDGGGGRRC